MKLTIVKGGDRSIKFIYKSAITLPALAAPRTELLVVIVVVGGPLHHGATSPTSPDYTPSPWVRTTPKIEAEVT